MRWLTIAFVLCMIVGGAMASAAAKRPHIVVIVADDLGWDDVGFRSHQIRTPNIDGLASEGRILTQQYAQCVCSPTRTALLSGRYPLHTSINEWIPPQCAYGLNLNETTIADELSAAGYAAHATGKWHAGFYKWGMTPTFRGFNSYTGFYSGGEDYFTHMTQSNYDFRSDEAPYCGANCSRVDSGDHGTYSAHVFTSAAVDIINEHDPNTPLFLYLAYQNVHAPAEVPQSYVDAYNTTIQSKRRRTFAGMLSAMDEGIGNVTAALRAKGMMDDLLLMFTADNGGPTTTGDGVGSSNAPFRGGKHSIWEGGTRATSFVWGKMLKQVGEYDNLMHVVDWLPTILDAAGAPRTGKLPLDGVSHWNALNDNTVDAPRTEVLYGYDASLTHNGLRQGKWKLLDGGGGLPDTWIWPANVSSDDEMGHFVAGDVTVPRLAASCNATVGVCFPGNDIKYAPSVTSADACCTVCQSTHECAGWTFRQGEGCWVKSKLGTTIDRNQSCTSGTAHGPAPAGHDWQLYDLEADPIESNNVAAANPDVVQQMAARLAEILATGVPNAQCANKPGCPPLTHPKDPVVGGVWAPWC